MSEIIHIMAETDDISEYERNRYANMQRNFKILKSAGLIPRIPNFMRNKKKKDVKSKQEEISKGSELQKFVDRVRGPSTRKQLNKKKKGLNLACGKEWIGIFLKFAKKYLETVDQQTLSVQLIYEGEAKYDIKPKRRYPRRNIEKKCYKEEDISSEDEYLYCDECGREYKGVCPVHGPMLWVCDRKIKKNTPNRADGTLPSFLSIGRSGIPKAGLGIWTEIPLPQGMVFGPFQGRFTRNSKEARKTGYAWKVWKARRANHFILGEDKGISNWLRFVNCADREERQTLMAFQYKKQVYYKTYKAVLPFTELLIWYGNDFAQDLGINTKEEKNLEPPAEVEGFKCDVCGGLFSTCGALERHQKSHPRVDSDRRHKCHHCHYSTNNTTALRQHLLTHSGERPHACPLCHKAFRMQGHVRRHILTHTGEKPFSCDTCGKAFNQLDNLQRHERVHSGERPYRCPTCGGDFAQATDLQRHERLHTQQKPYKCPHCDYRTAVSSALKQHTMRHHVRDHRHVCSICGKGFIAPSYLRKHTKRHAIKNNVEHIHE